ncbi:MAG: hypothetical protein KDC14_16550, partial [Planctomycetes bacterium]|nr:hypothetical protein [Planctomycetota bacterium]
QVGRIHWLMFGAAGVCFVGALGGPQTADALLLLAVVFTFVGACFRSLTVRDEGDRLALRYGPLPVFSKRIPFDSIRAVEATRSDLLDGWGVHWIPGRGWIWNLWGLDCVRLDLGTRVLRIGTDDPQGLESFLRERLAG